MGKACMAFYLSQEEFVKGLGVAYSTVNRGKALPGYRTMRAIDEFCKTHEIDCDVRLVRNSEVDENE